MKQALYQESYLTQIVLAKSLLINNYSKSLIRFSKKRKLAHILDNYNTIHKNIVKRKPAKIGYNTRYCLKTNNKAKCYGLLIPSSLIVEFEAAYVITVLFGLKLLPLNKFGRSTLLTCLLLKPKRCVFKGYCLGVLGVISKYNFLLRKFAGFTVRSRLSKSFNSFNQLINPFDKLDVFSKGLVCITRLTILGVVLNLKLKQNKFKYRKQFWLFPKRKPFFCFKASFKTKLFPIGSLVLHEIFKSYTKKQVKRLKRSLKRKTRRKLKGKWKWKKKKGKGTVKGKHKFVYKAANQKFKKVVSKWARRHFLS